MVSEDALKGSLNPKHAVDTIKYRIKFMQEHPFWFDPDGIVTFIGSQGSGKTLSAVSYTRNLLEMYPECIFVSNVAIEGYDIVFFKDWFANNNFQTLEQFIEEGKTEEDYSKYVEEKYDIYLHTNRVFPFLNNDDFMIYKNQERGVIFFIDEIQLYLNSLESKNINVDVITTLSQQRKQRLHIVCTTQVFGRMAKPLREQFDTVVLCKCRFHNLLQSNYLIDRTSMSGESSTGTELSGTVARRFYWFHSPELYESYDTYAVIESTKFAPGESQLQHVYSPTVIEQEVVKTKKNKKIA